MEGAMGTVVPAGLPKADSLPHYSHDKALPISRTYFYSLSGQDALDFPSPWGPSKACVRNGSSPGIHSPVTEGSITIPAIYRPENVSFPADSGHSAVQQELAAKQRLQAYYASSSKEHSPRAAGIMSPVGIPKTISGGSGMSSTAAESCAGLAIPKPVYGLSPCCAERGCTAGHNYGIEQGLHRMSPRMYEDEWSAHFSHLAYLHKNGQEPLAPQRVLQLDRGGEGMALKDSKTEGYHGISSDRTRRSLPVMEPGHSGYTYNAAHPFIASTPEYCQRIPIPPQMYKGLPITYEPMTLTHRGVPSKVYPDRPGIPKFTQIPPCSIIYYPQSSTEAYRADPHVVTDKQAHHMGQFNSSQHDFNNMSNSCSPRHPLITSFATHHPYGVHFNANPAALHNRPRFPMHQSERPLDFSVRRVQTPDSPRELCRQSGTSGAFHPTAAHYRCLNSPAAERSTLDQSEKSGTGLRIDGCKEFSTISKSHDNVYIKEHRHHISDHSDRDSLSKRHKEECETTTEIEMPSKKRKTTTTHEHLENSESPSSPPMPVINKVFSLAPYKVYFEATGLFSPPGLSKSPNPQSEDTQVKQEPEIQNSASESNSGENDLSLRQKAQASLGNSRASVEIPETVKIKKEKLDPDETSYQSEMKASIVEEMNHQTHNSEVKERQGELNSSMFDSVQSQIVIKSDCEEESKPPLVEISLSSAISKTEHDVKDGVESVPASMLSSRTPVPSLTPMTKFSLNKIPPHCLKLSNYKIVLPKALKAPVNETVDIPQSPVESKPTIASSKHARHQFMELHQSLCRLVYNRVTHTSCQDLRDWLSKLNLLESASYPNKTQKVSYLLGSKIRDVWLKGEEMVKALQKVVRQLNNYVESCECPFPHVMRAGAVFIPMLVVKEVLFPQVQGTFIDQVLQEHRVELRPTTLSEERQLTQLHRKAFSSKLRRLLSLKHLPDIYPDVLNLLYHAHVCKFLDSTASDGGQKLPRSRNQLNQDREYGQFR